MKGQKAYTLAQVVHQQMYAEPTIGNKEKQRELDCQYFELIRKAAYQGQT